MVDFFMSALTLEVKPRLVEGYAARGTMFSFATVISVDCLDAPNSTNSS